MGIDTNNRINRKQISNDYQARTSLSNAQQEPDDTSIFVSDSVDSQFAQNVIEQYADLSANNKKVSNVIVLATPDTNQIEEIKEIDDKDKAVLKDYIENGASNSYGFYSKKSDSIVIIQSNHNRKETKYEGELAEQGADTMLHEYAHLLDKNISSSDEYKQAYYEDLKAIEKQLKENPNAKIAGSDMTYKEAMVYFDHYYEGADFSDGIDESDVTRRGLRENFAESYATVKDNQRSEVNDIYSTLFPHTTEFVREYVA